MVTLPRMIKYDLFKNLLRISTTLKHEKFAEEREWRFVSQPTTPHRNPANIPEDQAVLFREGKSMILPYRKFGLANAGEPLPIKRIVIGPTPHRDLAKDSVIHLLRVNGIDGCEVELSDVPFRPW